MSSHNNNCTHKGAHTRGRLATRALMPALLATLTLLTACTDGTILHSYKPVSTFGWRTDDTITFAIPTTTRSLDIQATVGVRATDSYPYTTISLLTIYADADSPTLPIAADTITIPLYNTKGEPYATDFPYHTITHPLPTLHADSAHNYVCQILHIMPTNALRGITEIGLEMKIVDE